MDQGRKNLYHRGLSDKTFFSKIQRFDEALILGLQKFRVRPLTWVLILFTWTGKGRFWVSVAVALNVINHFTNLLSPYFLRAFYAPLIVWGINKVIKKLVGRPRPATANASITALVREDTNRSFPSSHSGSTFAFYFILLWWQFPEAKYFGFWALIVSFSRLYLGVHFLTDVIAGVIIGLMASGIVILLF